MRPRRLAQREGRRVGYYVDVALEPRDLWVGVYWKFHRFRGKIEGSDRRWGSYSDRPWVLDVYVCLAPCVVLHVNVDRIVRP